MSLSFDATFGVGRQIRRRISLLDHSRESYKIQGAIAIDLAGTNFLDSDSASILCRLKESGVELIGLHYFLQQIMQTAENE